tara:strand:- start:5336 stop:6013 length:678 start_codon:yes stop_codon:yes gene_type:complete
MPKQRNCLDKYYNETNKYEIGIDEAGRGPMFGRVYAAAVILPKDETFNHLLMKDSKKFTSDKKILEAYEYIKTNAIKWGVGFCSEYEIDNINIRNATHNAMHKAIKNLNLDINENIIDDYLILVDGRDFKQYTIINNDSINMIPNICIEGGDNKYSSIAAASILAKVERDKYIKELCEKDDRLNIRYGLLKNKGYGTSEHMNGIKTYGITQYHRKTFGICKNYCI